MYFECNRMLRQRSMEQRAAMMRTWGAYVHYLLRALGRLPNVVGDVFRGYPGTFTAPSSVSTGRVPLIACLRVLLTPLRWVRMSASVSTREPSQVPRQGHRRARVQARPARAVGRVHERDDRLWRREGLHRPSRRRDLQDRDQLWAGHQRVLVLPAGVGGRGPREPPGLAAGWMDGSRAARLRRRGRCCSRRTRASSSRRCRTRETGTPSSTSSSSTARRGSPERAVAVRVRHSDEPSPGGDVGSGGPSPGADASMGSHVKSCCACRRCTPRA